jgi:hypothetical protein
VFCAVADIRALIVRDSLVYFVLDDLRDTDPDFCAEEQWTTTRSSSSGPGLPGLAPASMRR